MKSYLKTRDHQEGISSSVIADFHSTTTRFPRISTQQLSNRGLPSVRNESLAPITDYKPLSPTPSWQGDGQEEALGRGFRWTEFAGDDRSTF